MAGNAVDSDGTRFALQSLTLAHRHEGPMSLTPDPSNPTRTNPTDTPLVADRGRLDDLLGQWAISRRSGPEPTPEDLCPHDPRMREALRHRIEAERLLEAR